jgi:AcrR family transcriptional regulator
MSKKDSILHAATLLFSHKGFKDTHMSEISAMTGAAEGTIFYHFKNKEVLFLSILEKFKRDIIDEFERYLKEMNFETGMDMLEGSLSLYLSLAETMQDRFLLLHRHDAYELAKVNSTCKEYLEAIYNCFVNIFEKAITTALIIFSMVDGLIRFNTYDLYDAGSLYNELIDVCRRVVKNQDILERGDVDADEVFSIS